ncbi:MAG: hypothetical protein FWD76_04495, partial [Firmicutes bacterium]|nr:hypothetical protein [Bacillota bacterium]
MKLKRLYGWLLVSILLGMVCFASVGCKDNGTGSLDESFSKVTIYVPGSSSPEMFSSLVLVDAQASKVSEVGALQSDIQYTQLTRYDETAISANSTLDSDIKQQIMQKNCYLLSTNWIENSADKLYYFAYRSSGTVVQYMELA